MAKSDKLFKMKQRLKNSEELRDMEAMKQQIKRMDMMRKLERSIRNRRDLRELRNGK